MCTVSSIVLLLNIKGHNRVFINKNDRIQIGLQMYGILKAIINIDFNINNAIVNNLRFNNLDYPVPDRVTTHILNKKRII